jgi:enamine deaminase RidA (YjgF/YER057c/UK114 family)
VAGAGGIGSSGGEEGSVEGGSSLPGSSSLSLRKRRKRDIGRWKPISLHYSDGRRVRTRFSAERLSSTMTSKPSERLRELGITLPPPPRPAGTYSPVVLDGERAWVSGQIVTEAGSVVHPGLVDRDVPVDVARELARRAALQALSALADALGSIDHVRRFLRVTVYVASSPGFGRQHEVANGATDLLVQLFGEAGRPARAAIGVAGLPLNAPVEVELLAGTVPLP